MEPLFLGAVVKKKYEANRKEYEILYIVKDVMKKYFQKEGKTSKTLPIEGEGKGGGAKTEWYSNET